jgi:hypothetical protein
LRGRRIARAVPAGRRIARAAPGFVQQFVAQLHCQISVVVVQITALRPALRMSACGKPTNTDAASTLPLCSRSMQRACSERFGSAWVPWRITCGSIGRLPHTMVGRTSPRMVRTSTSAALAPASNMSMCGYVW